jgi:glutathione S-transferase
MFKDRAIAGLPGGVPQIAELAERGRKSYARFLKSLDVELGSRQFVAGDAFSIADITAFITLDFSKRGDLEVPAEATNVLRWQSEVAARPSAKA